MKTKILLATTNNSKIKPFSTAWEDTDLSNYYEIILPSEFKSWQDLDISEDTGSCELDSLKKAKAYAVKFNMISISLDRCFGLAAFDGWPGTKAKEVLAGDEKRKLGIDGFGNPDSKLDADIKRSKELIAKLAGKDRSIESIYGIAVALTNGESKSAEVRISGTVAQDLRVTELGYFFDWFFIPEGYNKTMSEFEYDELLQFQSKELWPIPKEIEEFLIKNIVS